MTSLAGTILVNAALSPEVLRAFEAYRRNFQWAKDNDTALHRYENEFVAVAGGRVIAHADTREGLASEVESNVGVYITYVAKRGLMWFL